VAANVYEKLGATTDLEVCRDFIRAIEEEMEELATSNGLDPDGGLLDTVLLLIHINLPLQARGTKRYYRWLPRFLEKRPSRRSP